MSDASNKALTREALYSLVWSRPMLRVAARFGVSSSYMARVCTHLNVPRPQRGYWAKLAVGKAPEKPPLPPARPGDPIIWSKEGVAVQITRPSTASSSQTARRRRATRILPGGDAHPLVAGAKELFAAGRLSFEAGYLKPAKRLLIDLAVTQRGLDKAIEFANQLFLSLEARGHRVTLAPKEEPLRRADVDEREETTRNRMYNNLWSPGRCTVVYIGTVAIGLTVIELSEEVTVRYVSGEYVREADYVPPKRRRYDPTWTTTKHFGSGRLCLQAYSPYWRTDWVRQWHEAKGKPLPGRIPIIIADLEKAVDQISQQYEAGLKEAELEEQRWQATQKKRERERAEARAAKALSESKQELMNIIEGWAETRRWERFFAEVERLSKSLSDNHDRDLLLARVAKARKLLATDDLIGKILDWKLPDEQLD